MGGVLGMVGSSAVVWEDGGIISAGYVIYTDQSSMRSGKDKAGTPGREGKGRGKQGECTSYDESAIVGQVLQRGEGQVRSGMATRRDILGDGSFH